MPSYQPHYSISEISVEKERTLQVKTEPDANSLDDDAAAIFGEDEDRIEAAVKTEDTGAEAAEGTHIKSENVLAASLSCKR